MEQCKTKDGDFANLSTEALKIKRENTKEKLQT
jgi:hypothetical protein